jgi:hypothetical protein
MGWVPKKKGAATEGSLIAAPRYNKQGETSMMKQAPCQSTMSTISTAYELQRRPRVTGFVTAVTLLDPSRT